MTELLVVMTELLAVIAELLAGRSREGPQGEGCCRQGKGARRLRVKSAVGLQLRYAMSGTDIAYGAIGLQLRYATSGSDIAYGAIGLQLRYAMSGTDIACGAIGLRLPMQRPVAYSARGTELGYGANRGHVLGSGQLAGVCVCQRGELSSVLVCSDARGYAMSGTDLGYCAIRRYAMSGTDLGHGATIGGG
eukprot:3941053-Rhodomonas_salina.3